MHVLRFLVQVGQVQADVAVNSQPMVQELELGSLRVSQLPLVLQLQYALVAQDAVHNNVAEFAEHLALFCVMAKCVDVLQVEEAEIQNVGMQWAHILVAGAGLKTVVTVITAKQASTVQLKGHNTATI